MGILTQVAKILSLYLQERKDEIVAQELDTENSLNGLILREIN